MRIVGDPAGSQRAQTDERSVFDVLRSEKFEVVPAPTNKLAARLAAVERLLSYVVDGGAAHIIDPRCKQLIAAFSGGYRFRVMRNGEVDSAPDKNKYSHIMDGHQYVCTYVTQHVSPGGMLHVPERPVLRAVKRVDMSAWV